MWKCKAYQKWHIRKLMWQADGLVCSFKLAWAINVSDIASHYSRIYRLAWAMSHYQNTECAHRSRQIDHQCNCAKCTQSHTFIAKTHTLKQLLTTVWMIYYSNLFAAAKNLPNTLAYEIDSSFNWPEHFNDFISSYKKRFLLQ